MDSLHCRVNSLLGWEGMIHQEELIPREGVHYVVVVMVREVDHHGLLVDRVEGVYDDFLHGKAIQIVH